MDKLSSANASDGPRAAGIRPGASYSLRWRLPLLIAALMAVLIVSFLGVAYREVRAKLSAAALAQAQATAEQLAGLFAQSNQQRVTDLTRLAARNEVRQLIERPDAAEREAATAALAGLKTNLPQVVEIWNARGERLLTIATPPGPPLIPSASAPPATGPSPLRAAGTIVYGETVVEIGAAAEPADHTGRRQGVGFLVVRRAISASSTADALNRLVGHGASIGIGNKQGHVWTDLAKATSPPPISFARTGPAQYRGSDGEWRLGSLADVRGTPWTVWVEFPERLVMAPARAFLQRMALIAIGFVVIATIGIRAATGYITTPLHQLTLASEAIAAGNYSNRVPIHRGDEIGRLSAAFNTMTEQVANAHRGLEERVQRRTVRLEEATQLLAQRVKELNESREELNKFFSLSLDLLCIADNDGRLVRVNPAWQDVLGWTPEELTSQPYNRFIHPDDRDATAAQSTRLAGGGTVMNFENRYRHQDGSYRWLSWKAASDTERGVIYAAARDVTEAKRAARDLEQHVQELDTLNRELESFSYSVSHDLRAPLRHITGFAMLLRQNAEGLDADARRQLQVIADAAAKMGRLIDDLLSFSRVGRTAFHRTRVDLNRVVREAKDEVTADVNGRAINWKIDELPNVSGDPSLLRLVMLNLLSNALKYSSTRERTTVEIGTRSDGDNTVVFVRDNGVGFDMQYVDKLFGVFQRLHRADEFEGTGIGLANVQRIVQRHGGRAWAEGRVGEGATFYFSLPKH